jgi:hypothetical protein
LRRSGRFAEVRWFPSGSQRPDRRTYSSASQGTIAPQARLLCDGLSRCEAASICVRLIKWKQANNRGGDFHDEESEK